MARALAHLPLRRRATMGQQAHVAARTARPATLLQPVDVMKKFYTLW
jgi:hypothetical protein